MSDRKKSSKRKKPLPLPKAIRDELRLTCALKGFSAIKCGKSQKAPEQRERLSKNCMGNLRTVLHRLHYYLKVI